MAVTIRSAVGGDYDAVCGLYRQVDRLHAEHAPYCFLDGGEFPRTRAWFDAAIAAADGALLVVEQDATVVGLVRIAERRAPDGPPFVSRRFVMVEELVVRDDRRRSGVGRRLMEHAHAWARQRGIDQVELTVWQFNEPAQSLFKQLGYATVQQRMRSVVPP